MRETNLLLVLETTPSERTDNVYYLWILRNYFAEYVTKSESFLHFNVEYIYLSGKTNYAKPKVLKEIRDEQRKFGKSRTSYVIYCLDLDTTGKADKQFVDEVHCFCVSHGYYLSLANKEIEDVFDCSLASGKVQAVKTFAKRYPSKSAYPKDRFFKKMDQVRFDEKTTNFGDVVETIIEIEKERKS